MQKTITLAMGNGGAENQELIQKVIFRHLGNPYLQRAEDATLVEPLQNPLMTTDSFTITPLFFPGGDIGKLAVAGACNDIAMQGGKPRFLTLSFIIEEGLGMREFERVVRSIKKECAINEVDVVAGDTKVVPKGGVDRLFINISVLGEQLYQASEKNIEVGDALLLSGDIARHGAAIFAAREGIELQNSIQSDCRSLWPIVKELIASGVAVKAMRDATRGGVAAVLNEWAQSVDLTMEVAEEALRVSEEVRGICEILGFEPTTLANEGTFLLAVALDDKDKALEILRRHNPDANIIGEVGESYPKRVVLHSPWGTRRFLDMPSGEILPRIC